MTEENKNKDIQQQQYQAERNKETNEGADVTINQSINNDGASIIPGNKEEEGVKSLNKAEQADIEGEANTQK